MYSVNSIKRVVLHHTFSWIRIPFPKACWCSLSKLVHACRNYSLPKLARFVRYSICLYLVTFLR